MLMFRIALIIGSLKTKEVVVRVQELINMKFKAFKFANLFSKGRI